MVSFTLRPPVLSAPEKYLKGGVCEGVVWIHLVQKRSVAVSESKITGDGEGDHSRQTERLLASTYFFDTMHSIVFIHVNDRK